MSLEATVRQVQGESERPFCVCVCVCACDLLCDEHLLCVLGELSRPHNHTVHGRTLPGSPPPLLLRGPPSLRVVRLSESTFLYILHVSI